MRKLSRVVVVVAIVVSTLGFGAPNAGAVCDIPLPGGGCTSRCLIKARILSHFGIQIFCAQ